MVYDSDTDELIKSFSSATSCVAFQIDASSSCPKGANILIKTTCAPDSDCKLKCRSTRTTADKYCSPSSPPSSPDYSGDAEYDSSDASSYSPTPSDYSSTPSGSSSTPSGYYVPDDTSDSGSMGLIVGAAVGGVIAVCEIQQIKAIRMCAFNLTASFPLQA